VEQLAGQYVALSTLHVPDLVPRPGSARAGLFRCHRLQDPEIKQLHGR
jgi:hypothetical protein